MKKTTIAKIDMLSKTFYLASMPLFGVCYGAVLIIWVEDITKQQMSLERKLGFLLLGIWCWCWALSLMYVTSATSKASDSSPPKPNVEPEGTGQNP